MAIHNPRTNRRLSGSFQYGLSSLFVFVSVAAVFFASVSSAGLLGGQLFLITLGLIFLVAGLWRRRGRLLAVGVASLLLAFFSWNVVVGPRWVGRMTFVLEFRIVDAAKGCPIQGAQVNMFQRGGLPSPRGMRTDENGEARIAIQLQTAGSDDLFQKRGYIAMGSAFVEVLADGYEPLEAPLWEYTGEACDLYGEPIPPITVSLRAKRDTGRDANAATNQ